MSSKMKKGRNPAAVDNWLDSMGLYRKNVAYDETCLFRCISEQLFECQIYHERVRKECVDYGRKYFYYFHDLLEDTDDWFNHMDLLEKHMVVCGNIELQLISHKYNRDVVVYDASHQKTINVTQRNLDSNLMLCLMNEDHYDVVHMKEHIQNAGFCQSIVYNILYENVFEIPNVQSIVHGMLYEKEFVGAPFGEINNNLDRKIKNDKRNNQELDDEETTRVPGVNVAPFPFKVAKALDPTIYRNIEYDSWTEVRREMRLGEWYYGDDNLILGTRCILNQNSQKLECYIQEIIKDHNKCVVYVTKLAEKRTVNYTDLSPENDAKPWPLPYRFTKNLVLTPVQTPPEKILKLPKKRKDKRRAKSSSESQTLTPSEPADQDIEAFIGVPLQMQDTTTQANTPQETPPQEVSLSQHNLLVTPDIPSPLPKFSWETPWSNAAPQNTQDKLVWSQSPGNYNVRPMVASAPVTPNVIPYHGSNTQYPYMYNYHVDNYNMYGPWYNCNEYNPHNAQYAQEAEVTTDKTDNYEEPPPQTYDSYETPPNARERPALTLPLPSNQVEVYSPVVSLPPGTPVMYTHPPEMPEMVVAAPSYQVYTPPIDVQYISPAPYYYSPTIPTTWYPVGLNSQGFIFPTPPANQNVPPNN